MELRNSGRTGQIQYSPTFSKRGYKISCNYVIQKSSIVFLPNTDLINICFKIGKIFLYIFRTKLKNDI